MFQVKSGPLMVYKDVKQVSVTFFFFFRDPSFRDVDSPMVNREGPVEMIIRGL